MKENRIDLIEVMLKQEIGYPLTIEEELYLSKIDDDIKITILDLINDLNYQSEVNSSINKIMNSLSKLSPEQQKQIQNNYQHKMMKACK